MLPQQPQPAQLQPARVAIDSQPQSVMEMNPMDPLPGTGRAQQQQQQPSSHHGHTGASRTRGGGAAKDCFIGAIGAFLCFESCEACCHCIGDIICCPCEMCC